MNKKKGLGKICLLSGVILFLVLFISESCIAKIGRSTYVKLTMENSPEIGGIAVLKLVVLAGYDVQDADIGCFLPQGLELINDKGYKINFLEPPESGETGNNVKFYSGSMKKGERREIVFRMCIPDEKRYIIGAGGLDGSDYLEIDLGDPEPPELKSQSRQIEDIREIKSDVQREIQQLQEGKTSDFSISKDSLPPIRTELNIRPKDKPYYNYWEDIAKLRPNEDIIIPVRYLVYTEEEVSDLKATIILPKGLEFIKDKENYEVSTLEDGRTEVLLYSGPMSSKQSQAFYFKVKAFSREKYSIKASTEFTNSDGKKLVKEDSLPLSLTPKLL